MENRFPITLSTNLTKQRLEANTKSTIHRYMQKYRLDKKTVTLNYCELWRMIKVFLIFVKIDFLSYILIAKMMFETWNRHLVLYSWCVDCLKFRVLKGLIYRIIDCIIHHCQGLHSSLIGIRRLRFFLAAVSNGTRNYWYCCLLLIALPVTAFLHVSFILCLIKK